MSNKGPNNPLARHQRSEQSSKEEKRTLPEPLFYAQIVSCLAPTLANLLYMIGFFDRDLFNKSAEEWEIYFDSTVLAITTCLGLLGCLWAYLAKRYMED